MRLNRWRLILRFANSITPNEATGDIDIDSQSEIRMKDTAEPIRNSGAVRNGITSNVG